MFFEISTCDNVYHVQQKRKKTLSSCLKICLNPFSTLPGDEDDCKKEMCTESCPEGWVEKLGSCYFWARTDDKKTWEEAQQFCRNEGGQLPVVTSKAVNEYLVAEKKRRHSSHLPIWLGGSDKEQEGVWKWSDCSLFKDQEFTAWAKGSPSNHGGNQHCLEVWQAWNDADCKKKNNFVCAKQLCPPGFNK